VISVFLGKWFGAEGAGRLGRVLAALTTACAPLVFALAHLGITEPLGPIGSYAPELRTL